MIETIKIGSLKWHHIYSPSDENLNFLEENFDFHPLDIEDCQITVQRPKLDTYDDYYFMIFHFPSFDKANKFVKTKEVKIFLGKDYIITIGKSHWVIRNLFAKTKENPEIISDEVMNVSSDAVLYRILEGLMKESMELIKRIATGVDQINAELFNKKNAKTIEKISITRKNIILLDTIFKPQLRLFHQFESGNIGFAENMDEYWGNILDYSQRMMDILEDNEELIEGLSKTFDSMLANRTNEIIKVLTFFSSFMLPLTFITGLMGMNVGLPWGWGQDPNAFLYLSGIMFLIIIFMIIFFKRKGWM